MWEQLYVLVLFIFCNRQSFCSMQTGLCIRQASSPQALRICRLFQAQKVLDGAKQQSHGNHCGRCYQKLLRPVESCLSVGAKHNPCAQGSAAVKMQAYHVQPYAIVVDVVIRHNTFEVLNVGFVSVYVCRHL